MLVTPTPRCLPSSGMLRLSMPTCFGEFEGALDDVVGIDGPALASLSLLGGRLLGHDGHLHHDRLDLQLTYRHRGL